ncbi:MAG: amidase [Thermoleophilaceae bacterium]
MALRSLAEASAGIAAGELAPEELVEACLSRCEAFDAEIGAFAFLDADGARRQARDRAREIQRDGPRTPLHGIPVAVKDMIDVAGMPTAAGSRVLAGNVAAADDAEVVRRMRAAGAVILGKTTTHELASGIVTPQTANPWDTRRIAGGSSGGSAAAVAAGMCLGALGTDTSGSIRIPSALCGVTGLKPRATRVPTTGILPLAPSLDSCGPIAHGAADVELLWRAIAVEDDPPPSRPRIGRPAPEALGDLHPEVAAGLDRVADALAGDGLRVVPVELPPFADWDAPRAVVLTREVLLTHREAGWYPARADDYGAGARALLEAGERVDADQIVRALQALRRLTEHLLGCFSTCDALLLPTTPAPAPARADVSAAAGDSGRPPINRVLTRFCAPANICTLAAATVPSGRSGDGLPLAAQLVARDEATALAVALRYQSLTDDHIACPPLLADATSLPRGGIHVEGGACGRG